MTVSVVESVYGFESVAVGVRQLGVDAIGPVRHLQGAGAGLVGQESSAGDDDGFSDGMPGDLSGGVGSLVQLRIGRVCVDLPRLIGRLALTMLLTWAVFVVVASFLSVSNDPILPGAVI